MGNLPKVSVAFSNGNLLQNIQAVDGQAALIGTGTGTSLLTQGDVKIINSLADLEALDVKATIVPAVAFAAAIAAVAATATLTVTAVGADNDTIDVKANSTNLVAAPVIKTASETTPTLLATKIAAAINAYTGTSGYSASSTGAVVTVTAPIALGANANGMALVITIVGTITKSQTAFASGVNAAAEVAAQPERDNVDLYRHVKEFYTELGGNQELHFMILPQTVRMAQMLDITNIDYAKKLIEAGEGKIGILGVFRKPDGADAPGANFMHSDVSAAVLISKTFAQGMNLDLKFFRILIEGRVNNEASATIFAPNTSSNGFAGVVLGGTLNDKTASVGLALGRKIKYACHIKLGKVANGALSALQIYIGTKLLSAVTNLDALHGKGYISFVTYPNKAGFYFGIDNMASNDDYKILVHGAVVDAAAKIAAAVYIDELESEVDTNPNGTITDLDAKHLEDRVTQQVNVSLGDRISGFEALVDRTVNIINTNLCKIKLRVRPKGYLTFIEVDLGLTAG